MAKYRVLRAIAGLFFIGVLAAAFDPRPVLLQSLESKTATGGPVFNRVAWFPGWNRDVWMMQQSHDGLTAPSGAWDRIAIVVDHTTTPQKAEFIQLAPGDLDGKIRSPARPFRTSCFLCHSNGPRAIRPDEIDPTHVGIGAWDRARLAIWNFRIAAYGRILGNASPRAAPSKVHFRYDGFLAGGADKLPIVQCEHCHNDSVWGRGELSRQNFLAIAFMVERKLMPPPGFRLSKKDEKEIWRFVRGFPIMTLGDIR